MKMTNVSLAPIA